MEKELQDSEEQKVITIRITFFSPVIGCYRTNWWEESANSATNFANVNNNGNANNNNASNANRAPL